LGLFFEIQRAGIQRRIGSGKVDLGLMLVTKQKLIDDNEGRRRLVPRLSYEKVFSAGQGKMDLGILPASQQL
jgi:hypothetical protein